MQSGRTSVELVTGCNQIAWLQLYEQLSLMPVTAVGSLLQASKQANDSLN
jgi:hypothetical protein